MRLAAAAGVLLVAISAGAHPAGAAPAAATCFDAREVNNVGGRDGQAFHVRVNAKQIWRIELQGPCLSLPWLSSTTTTIHPRTGGDGICPGDTVTVTPNWGGGSKTCRMFSARRLTAAEAAALPKRLQP